MSTPEQRSMAASAAAHARWAQVGPAERREAGARGRRGLIASITKSIDPDGTMDPAERAVRVESAVMAHTKLMQLRSSQSRARKKAERDAAKQARRVA